MEPSHESTDDDLRPEYDFSQMRGGVRGKYFHRRRIVAEPDFPSEVYEQTAAHPPGALPRPKLTPEETHAFLKRMGAEMEPVWAGSVLPIWCGDESSLRQCGTGTLFRVAGMSFLVTASHVVDFPDSDKSQFYISDSTPGHELLLLSGRQSGNRNPTYDVAVWELPPKLVAALPDRTFLTVHHADRGNRRVTKGVFAVRGYPECWTQLREDTQKAGVTPITYMTGLFGGHTSHLPGYDPAKHILLPFAREGNESVNGMPPVLPGSFKGISGCSLWQLYYEGLSTQRWTRDDACVVAVQTGVYPADKLIRGTRWWVVERLLHDMYPELRGPLAIETP